MSNWWGASLLRAPVGYILALQSYQTYTNISNPCTNLFASTLFMISPLKGASSVLFFFYLNRKHLKVHLLSASREGQSQWQYTWHFFISHFTFLLPCPNKQPCRLWHYIHTTTIFIDMFDKFAVWARVICVRKLPASQTIHRNKYEPYGFIW